MTSFKHITIIGVGLIGGSLGLSIKRKFKTVRIAGISSPATLETALASGVIDQGFGYDQLAGCLKDADLIILCTPISHILKILPDVISKAKPGALITDAGSTKQQIVAMADAHPRNDVYFLGGHPMAGNEGRGVQWADRLLFENAVYVLTPSQSIPDNLFKSMVHLIETIGAKALTLPADLHDQVAAAISHLPQMLAVTLMNLVIRKQESSSIYLRLAAGGFRDMTRIASSPYHVWKDIIQTNHENIGNTIDGFIEELQSIKQILTDPALEERFDQSAQYRLSIPRDTKGFLRPNFDISIDVEDKPGVIAKIANLLAAENINIKDIEVLKVREGDSGTIRLSLESEEARGQAQALFEKHHIISRYRK